MIVDTSAILAVLFQEPDAAHYAKMIAETPHCRLSVASLLEASIVLQARGGMVDTELDLFIEKANIELVPFSLEQASAARDAWRQFGKGHHPAGLNFGDCFAYALAHTSGEPLLFKGDDFARTDIRAA